MLYLLLGLFTICLCLPPPPPFAIPPTPTPTVPLGGTVTWPRKHRKYKAPKKAPKLLCTVILWYRFVVQSPPQGGGPVTS